MLKKYIYSGLLTAFILFTMLNVYSVTPIPGVSMNGKTALKIRVGTGAYYHFEMHASVGLFYEFSISNKDVIRHLRTNTHFVNPDHANKPGGDRSNGVYWFKAIKEGVCIITINRNFRGNIEKSEKIRITVY